MVLPRFHGWRMKMQKVSAHCFLICCTHTHMHRGKYILQIWTFHDLTNTFYDLDEYIFRFGQIHFMIWQIYFWFGQINFMIWTNAFYDLNKSILWLGQIHFRIWTNTFWNLDKYNVMQCSVSPCSHQLSVGTYFQTNAFSNFNKYISWSGQVLKSGPCDAAEATSWDQCWHLFP